MRILKTILSLASVVAALLYGMAGFAQVRAADEPRAQSRHRFDSKASAQHNERIRRTIAAQVSALTAKVRELDVQISRTRAAAALESQPEGIGKIEDSQAARREELTAELTAWLSAQKRFHIESICGFTDDSQDVELYNGSAGPSRQFVMTHQPATAQIQWDADLGKRFTGAGDDAGDVQGIRWCTGTLIHDNLLLTAGHCFDAVSADWKLPRRASKALPSTELAKLMHVNFNYQVDAQTKRVRAPATFPIVRLVEHRNGGLDYAIVELGASGGEPPQKQFRPASLAAAAATLKAAKMLTIIQHPDGNPKKVAAGAKIRATDQEISYSDVDTQGGASGSGILDQDGRLIGVHTNGGCFETGGSNSGVTLLGISRVSQIIK